MPRRSDGGWPPPPRHVAGRARRSRCDRPSVGGGSALVYEIVLTAFLMFVIMAVATDTRGVGAGAAIAIGGTVGLDHLRRAGDGRVHEPGSLLRPRRGGLGVDELLDLRRRPVVGAAVGALAYQLVRGEHPEAARLGS